MESKTASSPAMQHGTHAAIFHIALNQCRSRERSTHFECEQQDPNARDLHWLTESDCRMSGEVALNGFQRAAWSRLASRDVQMRAKWARPDRTVGGTRETKYRIGPAMLNMAKGKYSMMCFAPPRKG